MTRVLALRLPTGTSLVVWWLRLHTSNAGDLGSILGQGTRSCKPKLKILHAVMKVPFATPETWYGQIKKQEQTLPTDDLPQKANTRATMRRHCRKLEKEKVNK